MKFSKRTEYAIRAMVHFAKLGTAVYAQSRDLSKQERLPTKFLEAVLLGLKRSGYLESKVGSGGGYRLSKPASRIVIGELIRKLEDEELAADEPMNQDAAPGESALHMIRQRIVRANAAVLDKLTLEEVVDEVQRNAKSKDAMYYI